MSVVDGDWEDLKRYNLTELYKMAAKVGEKGFSRIKGERLG
jgi:hypothetical protein